MITWDPALATGDASIDAQHQELFSIIGDLYEACVDGRTDECVDAILERLTGYTSEHFAAEQALMARVGYPPAEVMAHTTAHIDLTRQVAELIAQRERSELVTVLPVTQFLHEWLRTHIRQTDRRLVEYIQGH